MFSVFGVQFHIYGLILGAAALAGLQAALWLAKRRKLETALVEQAFWWALLPGLIGARVYHVIDLWGKIYAAEPIRSLYLWEGGLGIWGGVLGGALGLALFLRLKTPKLSYWWLFDLGAFGLPLAQSIGRWGNFANRELEGKVTNLPWAIIDAEGNRVHPLFLYESLLNLGLFLVLLRIAKGKDLEPGSILAFYLIGYGLIRLVLEPLRPEEIVWVWQGVPMAQIFSFLALLAGVAIIWARKTRPN